MARSARVRAAAAVVGVASLIPACGGDDEAGDGTDEFCDLVAEPMSGDATDDEVADQMAALEAAAPPEIAEEMSALADLFASLQGIDLENASDEDLASFDTALAEFQPLSAELEAWTVDNCPGIDDPPIATTG